VGQILSRRSAGSSQGITLRASASTSRWIWVCNEAMAVVSKEQESLAHSYLTVTPMNASELASRSISDHA
jgi:hypothetical protein